MYDRLVPGLTGEANMVVRRDNTARHLGSGGVEVLATPEMVRLMEKASVAAVDHLLDDGYVTVGVQVDVRHLSPTPTGMRVDASAVLQSVDRKKLVFRVEASDERGVIGSGMHQRAIVDLDVFSARVEEKRHRR